MKGSKIYFPLIIVCVITTITFWVVKLTSKSPDIAEITPLASKEIHFLHPQKKSPIVSNVTFKDETFLLGINHRHSQKKDKITSFEDSLGSGVCVADFNNDGWDDLFFVNGSGNRRHFGGEIWWQAPQANQLYLNIQGQFFSDISADSGITDSYFGVACAAADINNDGMVDIIVANKDKNIIYQNMGNNKFSLVKNPFKDAPEIFSTSILVYDFNNDGLDDILFGGYVTFRQEQNVLELNAGFDIVKNTNFDPAFYEAQPDILYLNNGDFSFTQSTDFTTPNKHGRTLGFYREDKVVLALNDKGSPSQIVSLTNQKNPINSIVLNARDAEKITVPGNKEETLFLASDATKGGVYAISLKDASNDRSWDLGINDEHRLYANTWAVLTGDFNLDGFDDIFLGNGTFAPHPDTVQTTTGQPNTLLISNSKTGKFEQHPILNERILSSRGAVAFDFNNDGKLDIALNNNNDYPSVLVNTTNLEKSWLGLKCVPINLCKNVNLKIDGAELKHPFQTKTSFASQSASLSLIPVTSSPVQLQVVGINLKHNFEEQELNQYFLLNLEELTLSPIQVERKDIAESNLENREQLLFLLTKPMREPTATSIEIALKDSADEEKLFILNEMANIKNRHYFPLADAWAKSDNPEVALKAIGVIESLELEQSVPTLINLISSGNPEIACRAIQAFQFFYWKDEAVPERKNWAESELIKSLASGNKNVVGCAIDALAESESYRALQPLLKHLQSDNAYLAMKSARALGMLRQTQATTALNNTLFNSDSPFVRAQSLIALVRVRADLSNIKIDDIQKKGDLIFNNALIASLKISDDGVTADKVLPQLTAINTDQSLRVFDNLTLDQLFQLYEKISHKDNKNKVSPMLNITNQDWADILDIRNLILTDNSLDRLISGTEDSFKENIFVNLTEQQKLIVLTNNPIVYRQLCEIQNKHTKPPLCAAVAIFSLHDPQEIGNAIRLALNSGRYFDALSMSHFLSNEAAYGIAFNQLLNDPRLQRTEKEFMLTKMRIVDTSLDNIQRLLPEYSEANQLIALRNIQRGVKANKFSVFIDSYAHQSKQKSINYYANRFRKSSEGF